ncbi:hypothetical protein CsSME_00040097 [Camellia sinensis var. sinensis]
MAPEPLSGKSNMVTEKIDVYSFGIVMWELLMGDEPYADMHCASIIDEVLPDYSSTEDQLSKRLRDENGHIIEHTESFLYGILTLSTIYYKTVLLPLHLNNVQCLDLLDKEIELKSKKVGRGVSTGGGQSSLGYLFGGGETTNNPRPVRSQGQGSNNGPPQKPAAASQPADNTTSI